MLNSTTVQSTMKGQERLLEAMRLANLSQAALVKKMTGDGASDALKRLLGTKDKGSKVNKSVVKEFCDRINETYRENNPDIVSKNGRQIVIIRPQDIVGLKAWMGCEPIPSEFRALIRERTKKFYGRSFVFEAIKSFLDNETRGYFTIVGYPGMGKTAIAAKYVDEHKCICYFNILAEGNNKPERFENSVCRQLIDRYGLHDVEDASLPDLLNKVSEELSSTEEHLVIVVDALDEVEQNPGKGENILYLPTTLPNNVYFLLTRRPYHQNAEWLIVSPEVPTKELNLDESDFDREGVKKFIRSYPAPHSDADARNKLSNKDKDELNQIETWINKRNITFEDFVERLADKSENNFMYLRYVLLAIARGDYDDLDFKDLPKGLQQYYQIHWVRMNMDATPEKMIILFILVEAHMPLSDEMVAEIAQKEKYEVQEVLDTWCEYLTRSEVEGKIKYSFYHTSFLDYLEGRRELDSDRKIFGEVNQRMQEYYIKIGIV